MSELNDVHCPKCGEKLAYSVVSKLMEDSRITFSMAPHKGELLSAENVGGSIQEISKLLIACGDDMGVKTGVVVSGIKFDDGKIEVEMIITRHEKGVSKRA